MSRRSTPVRFKATHYDKTIASTMIMVLSEGGGRIYYRLKVLGASLTQGSIGVHSFHSQFGDIGNSPVYDVLVKTGNSAVSSK